MRFSQVYLWYLIIISNYVLGENIRVFDVDSSESAFSPPPPPE